MVRPQGIYLQVSDVPESYHPLLGHRAFTPMVTQGTRSPEVGMGAVGCWCTRHVISTVPSVRGSITTEGESEAA